MKAMEMENGKPYTDRVWYLWFYGASVVEGKCCGVSVFVFHSIIIGIFDAAFVIRIKSKSVFFKIRG